MVNISYRELYIFKVERLKILIGTEIDDIEFEV